MTLRVVVVGIPGVGKTTVVEKTIAGLKGAKVVTFGTVMSDEALRLKWIKNRDEMRKMPIEKQKRLQRIAAQKISRMKDPILFIDTHLFIRTPEGFWPGLPFEVARAMKPTHLVLVEARSEEIRSRRAADTSRARDAVTLEELESELALGRSFLAVSSTLTGAPMLVVSNSQGKADETASQLIEVLGKARS
jgi:adenylate kinase